MCGLPFLMHKNSNPPVNQWRFADILKRHSNEAFGLVYGFPKNSKNTRRLRCCHLISKDKINIIMQTGQISVQAENIFPIIKQFLYSDREVFLRELVSNAVDATNKLKTLALRGEVEGELGDLTIEIEANEEAKTLIIRDRGIGMTEEEVQKYLNQVAFSSAQEFLDKYKDDANIIGHFGLGFYSAFMVADKVEVRTVSYKKDAEGVLWICDGDPEYQIGSSDKTERGTEITLHISEDSTEFLEENRLAALLDKYCKFLPVPIQFGTRTETEVVTKADEEAGIEEETKEIEVANIINNPDPAWRKSPSELSDDDYRAFYRELYPMGTEPEFWIHLNVDHPFKLTGILYFPKLENSVEIQKNKIQLYSNQVYVTDDVSEIVPEWLTLLHGVIDSPDIPLNVSRSYLQSDSNVRKLSNYITKKVADKLKDLFKKDRSTYEEKFHDLGVFIKYGMMTDEKFNERAQGFVLLENTEGEYYTLEEYREKIKDTQTDKYDRIVHIYTDMAAAHDGYIQSARNADYDVLDFSHIIDKNFVQFLEQKLDKVTFVRVDSDTVDNLVQNDETRESVLSEEEQETVKGAFESMLGENAMAKVELKPLSPEDQPVIIVKPEFMRRFAEMQAMQGGSMMGAFPDSYNLVVNTNHPLIAETLVKAEGDDDKKQLTGYLYDLARLNQGMLQGKDLTEFINRSLGFLK